MKKLLFLSAPFEYYKGGSEYQYKVLEHNFKERYEIYYLFRHPTSLSDKRYINYDYKVRKSYNGYLYTDSLVIYRLIKELSPNIIYKRGVNYISAIGVYYAKLNKAKMILHIASQNDVEKFKLQFKKNIIFEFVNQYIAKYAINNADQIICQARYQKILLEKNYGRSCNLIIPNFHPIPEDKFDKTPLIKIVWVANFKQLKQPELFLKLAEDFQDNHNIKFIMIGRPGAGTWQKRLSDKMNRLSNLEYRGELSIDDVNRVLSESHIFVNTSQYEGFPNTYIQAWMRKVPVVALNVDPDDIIKTQRIGFHSKTVEQMEQDVKKLVDNEKLRKKMGEKSRKFACNTFSTSSIDKLINLIEQS
jgi:glycosyltransferase involved in cell wall biosynthesis